jgi:plasmid stability protein
MVALRDSTLDLLAPKVDIMMPRRYHQDVRTTLTLDEDVAAKLKAAARRSGRAFRDVVNDTLRRGLITERPARRKPFTITPRSLGGLRPGLRPDNIAELLEQIEGPGHR